MSNLGTTPGSKLKVFISYSRHDLEFADQLVAVLELQGFVPIIDRKGIHGAEKWEERLGQLILEADIVVFVLSPDSAESPVCAWEVEEATRRSKRIVPVLCRPLDGQQPHERLRDLNYIFFYPEKDVPGSGFGTGQVRLIEALSVDIGWLRDHTRLEELAQRWESGGRQVDQVLRGSELADTKAWRDRRPANAPNLTALQRAFVAASEEEEASRASAERRRLEEMAAANADRAKALADAQAALQREEEAQTARARQRRIIQWGSATATAVVAVLVSSFLIYNVLRKQELQRWQTNAYDGQFTLLLTKARDQLGADHPHEARSLALAANRILKEDGKQVASDLRVDFTNILIESLKYEVDVPLEQSAGTSSRSVNAAFTPDGKYIVWTQDGAGRPVNIADTETGRLLATQPRQATDVRALITSPDGSHAALLSERGDAELFALRAGFPQPNYFDLYRIDDMRAIAFGNGSTRPLLAAVDKHGTLYGWRFDAQGGPLGPTMRLAHDGRITDLKDLFAISCYDDLCVWVEPEGGVAAARAGAQPGAGWRPLRVTEKFKDWMARSSTAAPGTSAAPFIRLGKGQLFAYSREKLALYEVSVNDDALLLNRSQDWNIPALVSLDIAADGTLFTLYAPDRETLAWTVGHMQLTGSPGGRQFNTLYFRDYDKQIIDFNLPTKSVVFAPQPGAGLDALKRRADLSAHPQYKCLPTSCYLVNWIGASGPEIIGVNRNKLDGIEPGGIVYLMQSGKPDTAARRFNLHAQLVDTFAKSLNEPAGEGKGQEAQDQKKRSAPLILHAAQTFDAANGQVLALVVAPSAGGEAGTEGERAQRVRASAYVAALDLKTGRLAGPPVHVRTRNADDPTPQTDLIMASDFSAKLDNQDSGSRLKLRVLVGRGPNGTFTAEHAPNGWFVEESTVPVIRAGGPAGFLRRDGNFLRLERSDIGKGRLADVRSEIRLGAGRVADFGFLSQGNSVFIAYEEGQVDIWDLDAKAKNQPRSIITRTKLSAPQSVAWSLDQQVLHVRQGSTIKRFSLDGLLLDRYAPGRPISTMIPLAGGGLFAVVGDEHTVLPPPASTSVNMNTIPYVAEALTPRLMGRVDEEVVDNWFLPLGDGAADDRPDPACGSDTDKTYVQQCTLLRKFHATPLQRALAVSEHAYRTLERGNPGRSAAFALADAAAGDPLSLALVARELGRNDTGVGPPPESPIRDINCAADRVAAMRKLFANALQSGRLIAPFFVGVELQCAGVASDRADIAEQLRALSDRGDPMAFVLLGHELERSTQGDRDAIAKALENYGMAGRLLLGQRDGLLRKQAFADQGLITSIEQEVSFRRVKLAAQLEWTRLAEIFEKVENRFRTLQRTLAQDSGTSVMKALTVKDMMATLEQPDLAASLGKGEAALEKLVGRPMTDKLLTWIVRAHYEPVRRALGAGTAPAVLRAAYLQFLGAVQRLEWGIHAKAILELDQALDDQARQRVLSNDSLRELVLDFAQRLQLGSEGLRMSAIKRATLYLDLSAAASQASPKLAAPLAIAAVDKSEELPRNKSNGALLNGALVRVLQLLGPQDRYDREFAQLGWKYISYASDRPADMDAKDAMELFNRGLQLHQRYVDSQGNMPILKQRLAAAYQAAGQAAFKDFAYDRAIQAYDKVIELVPKDREGYMQRGTAYEYKRSYERAITDYTEALKLSPAWTDVYTYRADSYRHLGKYQEAVSDYTKAIELNPNEGNYLIGRGRVHLASGALDSAVEDFNQALKLRPKWDEGFRFRAIASILKGDYDRAVDDFTTAIGIDPADDNYYNGRAWAHFKAGRLNEALKDAVTAVSIERFNPAECLDTLGQILLARGKTEEANAAFAKAQARKPGLKLTLEDTLMRLAANLGGSRAQAP